MSTDQVALAYGGALSTKSSGIIYSFYNLFLTFSRRWFDGIFSSW